MLNESFRLFAILSLHCQYPSLAAEREDIILLMSQMYVHNQSKICNLYVFKRKKVFSKNIHSDQNVHVLVTYMNDMTRTAWVRFPKSSIAKYGH